MKDPKGLKPPFSPLERESKSPNFPSFYLKLNFGYFPPNFNSKEMPRKAQNEGNCEKSFFRHFSPSAVYYFIFLALVRGYHVAVKSSLKEEFMFRKYFKVVTTTVATVSIPAFLLAQSNTNTAPLGSQENPIKGTLVSTTPIKSTKAKKRGTKANPITGSTHPRGTNPN